MAKVALLFKTDFNHSYKSKELIGVFTNKSVFNALVKRIIKKDLTDNKEDDQTATDIQKDCDWHFQFFTEKNQTQGLKSFELFCEVEETNVLI